jgi:hypothetical protein
MRKRDTCAIDVISAFTLRLSEVHARFAEESIEAIT